MGERKVTASGGRGVGVHYVGDLRAVLLDAAVQTVDENGAEGASLREVARRAGVSHAAPAHHFVDKTGLLTAAAAEGFTRLARAVGKRVTADGDPIEQVIAMGMAYIDFATEHPGLFHLMFNPSFVNNTDEAYIEAGDIAFEALHHQVQKCQAAGWRPEIDSRVLTVAGWTFVHGIATLRLQGSLERMFPHTTTDDLLPLMMVLG